jgi:uncharacterized protein (TIGR02391 family)
MLRKYIEISQFLRSIRKKSFDASMAWDEGHGMELCIVDYVKEDLNRLNRALPGDVGRQTIKAILQEISTIDRWYGDTLLEPLARLEDEIDEYFLEERPASGGTEFVELLHPRIMASSYRQYRDGHYRESVFNAIVGIFDFVREKTGLDLDGAALVGEAFSLEHPLLAIGDLGTESGKNEQKGFIQILQGVYLGIRNPKAHTLTSDLNEHKAAQYLVMASLFARRIDEAVPVDRKA